MLVMCAFISARGNCLDLCGISTGLLHPLTKDKSQCGIAIVDYNPENIMPFHNQFSELLRGTWQGGRNHQGYMAGDGSLHQLLSFSFMARIDTLHKKKIFALKIFYSSYCTLQHFLDATKDPTGPGLSK